MLKTLFALKNEAALGLAAAKAAKAAAAKKMNELDVVVALADSAIALIQRLDKVSIGMRAQPDDCFEVTVTNKTKGGLIKETQCRLEILEGYPILRSISMGIVTQLEDADEVRAYRCSQTFRVAK